MDGWLTLRARLPLTKENLSASEWAAQENAKGHACRCGCGGVIKILARHRWHGFPQYLKAHHPMAMTKDVRAIRDDGLLTVTQVARELGIGATTLRRLEGTAYPVVQRRGYRGVRAFTREELECIRRWLQKNTGLGSEPNLVTLEQLARQAGCSPHTIRRYLGTALPAGRRQLAGGRVRTMFTTAEAAVVVAAFHARRGLSGRLRRGRRALPRR
jgi:DNA-binding transcriptional MerR regulator